MKVFAACHCEVAEGEFSTGCIELKALVGSRCYSAANASWEASYARSWWAGPISSDIDSAGGRNCRRWVHDILGQFDQCTADGPAAACRPGHVTAGIGPSRDVTG